MTCRSSTWPRKYDRLATLISLANSSRDTQIRQAAVGIVSSTYKSPLCECMLSPQLIMTAIAAPMFMNIHCDRPTRSPALLCHLSSARSMASKLAHTQSLRRSVAAQLEAVQVEEEAMQAQRDALAISLEAKRGPLEQARVSGHVLAPSRPESPAVTGMWST